MVPRPILASFLELSVTQALSAIGLSKMESQCHFTFCSPTACQQHVYSPAACIRASYVQSGSLFFWIVTIFTKETSFAQCLENNFKTCFEGDISLSSHIQWICHGCLPTFNIQTYVQVSGQLSRRGRSFLALSVDVRDWTWCFCHERQMLYRPVLDIRGKISHSSRKEAGF